MSNGRLDDKAFLTGIREQQNQEEGFAEVNKTKPGTFLSICPRCGQNYILYPLVLNPLSRVDNKTYICSGCGTEEGLGGAGAIQHFPIDRWYAIRIRFMRENGDFDDEEEE